MTREIKVRAWDKITKSMHEISSINFKSGVYWKLKDGRTQQRTFKNVVLIQYTGMKDKNGTEIYEGDVVKSPTYPQGPGISDNIHKLSTPSIVGWNERLGGWTIDPLQKGYEVVGNIYENPELLKEEK